MVAELASLGLLATPEQPQPRPIEWDDLGKLVYLNTVIKVQVQALPASSIQGRCAGQHIHLTHGRPQGRVSVGAIVRCPPGGLEHLQ